MSKQSSIETLPPKVKAKVDALIRSGKYTIDGLVVVIQEAGEDRSRSSVGRYAKNQKKAMEIYAEAQAMAKSLTTRFQEDPESDVGRMLGQVLRGLTYNTMTAMARDGQALPDELMLLSATIKNLAGADKIANELAARIRKQLQEELDKKITALAEKKPGGGAPVITPEALKAIREQVYGITQQPA